MSVVFISGAVQINVLSWREVNEKENASKFPASRAVYFLLGIHGNCFLLIARWLQTMDRSETPSEARKHHWWCNNVHHLMMYARRRGMLNILIIYMFLILEKKKLCYIWIYKSLISPSELWKIWIPLKWWYMNILKLSCWFYLLLPLIEWTK